MKKIFFWIVIFQLLTLSVSAQTLRDSIDVTKYDIHLRIDPYTQSIKGYTDVKITSKYNLTRLGLDLWGMFIDSLKINGQKINNFRYNSESFSFPYKLTANDTIKLTVFYHGKPLADPRWGGFYFRNLYAFNYGIGMGSNPLSLGRCWFPANDIFTDKALFDFYITTDTTMQAICNGLLADTTINGYMITWHWHLKEPIPAYLANVAVGRYKKIQWTYNGEKATIPVEIFLMRQSPDSAVNSLRHLNQVMHVYEKLFGPYRWEKIGYTQVPMYRGAMEHATNISIPAIDLNGSLKKEDLLYHELAHSWFGNLVTCATPGDMWINEGWAEYASLLYSLYIYGENEFNNRLLDKKFMVLNFAHKNDGGYKAIGNIDLPDTYGNTVYDKGALVVHTLRYQIGDSLFWPAVQEFLNRFAFGNATINQFRQTLEQYTGQDLKKWFDYWIYSPGFPHFDIKIISTKKKRGGYQAIILIRQETVGSKNILSGQKMDIAFVGKNNEYSVKQTTITGKITQDTFLLTFRPAIAIADPDNHIGADASTHEKRFIHNSGTYIFDHELFDMEINELQKPVYVNVINNWISPDNTLIDNRRYLLNSTYYWTIQINDAAAVKGTGKFYLTSLLDVNFRNLTPKQLQGLKLFYRKDAQAPWTITNAHLSDDFQYFELTDIKSGDYIIGYDRTVK